MDLESVIKHVIEKGKNSSSINWYVNIGGCIFLHGKYSINEAFAAIALACLRELGFAEDIVNVEGGAIAHGHPIGASGAVLAARLMYSMQRDELKRGVVTLCIGGGQGIALAIEML